MAYVNPNFKTKKALKEAIKTGEPVFVYQPGLGTIPENGYIALEGPHYPKPHTWYAEGTMKDGKLVKVVWMSQMQKASKRIIRDIEVYLAFWAIAKS